MYFAFKTYPGGGAFALFFHPHPREFATQNKKSANARGLARGGMGAAGIDWCIKSPNNTVRGNHVHVLHNSCIVATGIKSGLQ